MTSFEIPARLPSLNDYINTLKSPHGKYKGAEMKRDNDMLCNLGILKHKAELKQAFSTPSIVVFEWHEKTKKRDIDNVYSGKKYILDALQKNGVLKNDNPANIVRTFDTIVYDNTNRIVVYVFNTNETEEVLNLIKNNLRF